MNNSRQSNSSWRDNRQGSSNQNNQYRGGQERGKSTIYNNDLESLEEHETAN